jgi:hypothetical protein
MTESTAVARKANVDPNALAEELKTTLGEWRSLS